MPTPLAPVTLTAGAVQTVNLGTSITVGAVVIGNETPYAIMAGAGSGATWVLAQMADRLNCDNTAFNGNITLSAVNYLSNSNQAPSYQVYLTVYAPGETIPGTYPCALSRMFNVGNNIVSNSPANVFEQDFLTPFVYSGYVATKDDSVSNQLDIAAGIAFLRQQSDNSLLRIANNATAFLTTAPNATYFLDVNPDGSWSFATSHSGVTNHLSIAQVTTDASGNIAVVTDERTLNTTLLSALSGTLFAPNLTTQGVVMAGTYIATQGGPLYLDLPNAINGEAPGSVRIGQTSGAAGAVNLRIINATGGYVGIVSGGGSKLSSWDQLGNFTLAGTLTTPSIAIDTETGQTVIRSQPAANPLIIQVNGNNTVFNADGTLTIGGLGGQASAGSFGAPVIVAQAMNVAVTTTAQTIVLSFTPSATGMYRASLHYLVRNTGSNNLTARVSWTDPTLGTSFNVNFVANSNLTPLDGSHAVGGTIPLATMPISFNAKTGQTIQVYVQDPTNTPNDLVSVLIERLI